MKFKNPFRYLLGAVVLTANLFIIALVAYSLYESRQQIEQRAAVQTQNLATMLEQGVSSRIRNIDLTLRSVVEEHSRQSLRGGLDSKQLNDFLSQHLGRLPELEGLRMTNAQGEILYGPGVNPAARVSLADRDYFLYQRDYSEGAYFLGAPVKSRVSGNWIVALSRRLEKPNGEFDGMAYATVRLDELTRIFSSLELGAKGTVVLRDGNFHLVARYPLAEGEAGEVGNAKTSAQFRELVSSGATTATYFAHQPSDGVPRIYSYQKLPTVPWIVLVGLAESDFLVDWHRQALRYMAFALFFMGVSILAARAIWSGWRRQERTTQELQETQSILKTVTDLASDWVYWRSANRSHFYYLSPACEQVTGYTEQAFRDDTGLLDKLIHSDDQERWLKHLAHRQSHTGEEYRIVTKDGRERWISHSCHQVDGPDGEFMGHRGAFLDITEQKLAESALRASESRLATIFRATPMGICISSVADGRFVDVNDAFVSQYGLPREQLIGFTARDINFWVDPEQRISLVREITKKGSVHNLETRQRRADGQILDVLVSGETIRVDEEEFLLTIHLDITHRKQDEQALREAKDAADAANRAKSQFLAVMSHELRTPMNGILGMAQLLMLPSVSQEERIDYARTLHNSGLSLQTLLNDILDHSKIEAGRMELARVAYSPAQVLNETVALFQGAAAQKGLLLSTEIQPGSEQRHWGDPNRLRQILSNLTNNAIKFTDNGSVGLAVNVEVDDGGASWLRFTVRDTGIGIAPEKHVALFKSFSQVDDSFTRRHEGTGLGLAITRALVELMGGQVGLESTVGVGSTFWCRIPAEPQAPGSESRQQARQTLSQPQRVLDKQALHERLAHDSSAVGAAIGNFLSDYPVVMEKLKGALARDELPAVQRLGETLQGLAAKVAGLVVVDLAVSLSKASSVEEARGALPGLQQALQSLEQALLNAGEGI